MTRRILIADALAPDCVEFLQGAGFAVTSDPTISAADLVRTIGGYHGLLVRSRTKVTRAVLEAAEHLEVVGRAGVGVDNVDVGAATERGVIVMNTPAGNTISAAEHTVALLLALLRNVAPAAAAMRAGRWDRTSFTGHELKGKKVGVIGLGKIGREVAKRLAAFEVELWGFDPFLSAAQAKTLGVRMDELDALVANCDVLTVHTPLSPETRGLLNAERLHRCRPGACIINVARGGIVDEEALIGALDDGPLAGAALDVFTAEPPPADSPLRTHPKVLCTPHLGASTEEAQERVAIEVARQVATYFQTGAIVNAVNIIGVGAEEQERLAPYLAVAEALGRLHGQMLTGRPARVDLEVRGELSDVDVRPLEAAFFKGFFSTKPAAHVTLVNALHVAEGYGIQVNSLRAAHAHFFTSLILATVATERGTRTAGGALFGRAAPQIVLLDGCRFAVAPRGPMLFVKNEDRPGQLSAIAGVLGAAGINIATAGLGRDHEGGTALLVLGLDRPAPDEALATLRAQDGVLEALPVQFPEE